jgi:hypothetical protein
MKPLQGQPKSQFVRYASKFAASRRAALLGMPLYEVRNLRQQRIGIRPVYYVVGTLPGDIVDCVKRGFESVRQLPCTAEAQGEEEGGAA